MIRLQVRKAFGVESSGQGRGSRQWFHSRAVCSRPVHALTHAPIHLDMLVYTGHMCTSARLLTKAYTCSCTDTHAHLQERARGQPHSLPVKPVTFLCVVTVQGCSPGELAVQALNFCILQGHLFLQLGYLSLKEQQRIPRQLRGTTRL